MPSPAAPKVLLVDDDAELCALLTEFLGRFGKDSARFVAVLEGKGTRDPLDRPFAGRRHDIPERLPLERILQDDDRRPLLRLRGGERSLEEPDGRELPGESLHRPR